MRKTLLTSVSAAALTCSAAMPAVAAPPFSWTGFYVGANAGYAWGNADPTLIGSVSVAPFFLTGTTGAPPHLGPAGFIGGGQAGYNWQIGQWLLGGEVDFSGIDAKASASLSPFFIGKGNRRTLTWSSQYDWLFTARARGGFLIDPNWLLYVTGGLAVTRVKDSAICSTPSNGTCGDFNAGTDITWSDSRTLTAGTIGGGVEARFWQNWSARVEYLYANFKDTTPPTTSAPTSFTPVPPLFSFNHTLNVVRFAINYQFSP